MGQDQTDNASNTDGEAPDLHLQWSDLEDSSSYVNDLAGATEQVGDDATEPKDTLALAVTAAIASESLGKALDHDWALYTPQDAAVVASAIHATIHASIGNLRALEQAVRQVAERGDVTIPDLSGWVAPEQENLADALDRLTGTAHQLEEDLGMLAPAVHSLNKSPARYRPPANVHEATMAVAAIFGASAEIKQADNHRPDDLVNGCGCSLTITQGGDKAYFYYSDSGWHLMRHSAATVSEDGSMVWTNNPFFDVQEPLAHPEQSAQGIRSAMGAHGDA
ncbi:hypothetical protein AB0D12_31810 [Streptomyces sp. NPDC048479]|uniref:hypothetical protein n=1 Tax=Streptomyces sp. NPDC048479 TaxID=3154725 RepID=UPI0034449A36